jgi:hypothetical protein
LAGNGVNAGLCAGRFFIYGVTKAAKKRP